MIGSNVVSVLRWLMPRADVYVSGLLEGAEVAVWTDVVKGDLVGAQLATGLGRKIVATFAQKSRADAFQADAPGNVEIRVLLEEDAHHLKEWTARTYREEVCLFLWVWALNLIGSGLVEYTEKNSFEAARAAFGGAYARLVFLQKIMPHVNVCVEEDPRPLFYDPRCVAALAAIVRACVEISASTALHCGTSVWKQGGTPPAYAQHYGYAAQTAQAAIRFTAPAPRMYLSPPPAFTSAMRKLARNIEMASLYVTAKCLSETTFGGAGKFDHHMLNYGSSLLLEKMHLPRLKEDTDRLAARLPLITRTRFAMQDPKTLPEIEARKKPLDLKLHAWFRVAPRPTPTAAVAVG